MMLLGVVEEKIHYRYEGESRVAQIMIIKRRQILRFN